MYLLPAKHVGEDTRGEDTDYHARHPHGCQGRPAAAWLKWSRSGEIFFRQILFLIMFYRYKIYQFDVFTFLKPRFCSYCMFKTSCTFLYSVLLYRDEHAVHRLFTKILLIQILLIQILFIKNFFMYRPVSSFFFNSFDEICKQFFSS